MNDLLVMTVIIDAVVVVYLVFGVDLKKIFSYGRSIFLFGFFLATLWVGWNISQMYNYYFGNNLYHPVERDNPVEIYNKEYTLKEAKAYCEALSLSVPSLSEYRKTNNNSSLLKLASNGCFWTQTKHSKGGAKYYVVNPVNGNEGYRSNNGHNTCYVMCFK